MQPPRVVTIGLLCVLFCFTTGARVSTDPDQDCGENPRHQVKNDLHHSMQLLLNAIRTVQPEKLLELVSKDGMDFGVDNEISYDVIRTNLRNRGDMFCHYFDSTCLQDLARSYKYQPGWDQEGQLPLPVSYSEILQTASALTIKCTIKESKDDEGVIREHGLVSIKWEKPRPRSFGRINYLEFLFKREEESWKLIADLFP